MSVKRIQVFTDIIPTQAMHKCIVLLLILGIILPSYGMLGKEYTAKLLLKDRQLLVKNLAKQGISIRFPFESFIQKKAKSAENTLSTTQYQALEKLTSYAILSIPDTITSSFLNVDSISLIGPLSHFTIDEAPPNDSLWTKQWAHETLNLSSAWNISKGDNVLVAVIDTGCDSDHKDLQQNLWINASEDLNKDNIFQPWFSWETFNGKTGDLNGLDDDGNGWSDDVIGYDVVDQSIPNIGDFGLPDPIPYDEHGHGTSVAGIIGAVTNNTIGIAGVAPHCTLMSIRAFDATGNAEEDDVAIAIVYAAMNKARVICMSFGDIVYSPMTNDAIAFAHAMNCTLIASSGNDGKALSRYPASYNHVLSVGATNQQDFRAPFSSFGSQLSVCAPGIAIPTTARGNSYRSFQGTSAAAPFVAGTAALILAKQPTLLPNDIRGILESSAIDKGELGWDPEYGAGRIDPVQALMSVGFYKAGISAPFMDQEIITNKTDSLFIIGSTAIPLCNYWNLSYGYGELPQEWNSITDNSFERVLNDTLGVMPLTILQDSTITLRLTIKQSNERSAEYRTRISTSSFANTLTMDSLALHYAWKDDKKVIVLAPNFSRKCRAYITIKNSSEIVATLHDDDKRSKLHFYTVDIPKDEQYTLEVYAQLLGHSDTLLYTNTFTALQDRATVTGVVQMPYSLPMTYLFNTVFFNDNIPSIAGTDYSKGTFGDTRIYSFVNNSWTLSDSLHESWIIRGRGDTDGDGIPELLTHSLGEARLFEKGLINGKESQFGRILFTDKDITSSISRIPEFWSAGLIDIDRDGKDEIIGFSDTTCLVLQYTNGAYSLLASLPNTTNRGNDGSMNSMRPPTIASGDFDGDGKMELAYGDTDGDCLVFEYDGGSFKETFRYETAMSGSTEFTASADIDNDGKKELIVGHYQSPESNSHREYEIPLWIFTFFRSDKDNHFIQFHEEKVYGVRAGLDYRNGISTGNVDDKPGDEVLLCLFPNLYVFGQNADSISCKWYYPECYSNGPVLGDINGNGKTEFGFGDGNTVVFAEFEAIDFPAPKGLESTAINDSSAFLHWQGNAQAYEIYAIKDPFTQPQPLTFIGKTDSTYITITQLQSSSYYRFYVKALYAQGESNYSNGALVFIHAAIKPKTVQYITNNTSGNAIVKLTYSGLVSSQYPSPTLFSLVQNNNNVPISTVIPAGDSSVLLITAEPLQANQLYTVRCGSFNDYYGSPTIADSLLFETDEQQTSQQVLYLTSINAYSEQLYLRFSEPVIDSLAHNASAYSIEPRGTVQSAMMIDEQTVLLNLDPSQPLKPIGKNYLLTAQSIIAKSGAKLSNKAGNSIGFSLFASGSDAFCYPQPWKTKESSRITFAGLPNNASITIRRVDGEIIGKIQETAGNGGVTWDGILLDGSMIESGVYLYSIDSMYKAPMYKFTVIR